MMMCNGNNLEVTPLPLGPSQEAPLTLKPIQKAPLPLKLLQDAPLSLEPPQAPLPLEPLPEASLPLEPPQEVPLPLEPPQAPLPLDPPQAPLEPLPPSLKRRKMGEKVHGCVVCSGRAYTSRKALDKHISNCHKKLINGQAEDQGDNPNACPLCTFKVFKSAGGLKRHNKSFHANFLLSSKNSLTKEVAPEAMDTSEEASEGVKNLKERLTCSRCPKKTFKSLQGLRKHTTQAHKEKLILSEVALEAPSAPEAAQPGSDGRITCTRCPRKKAFKTSAGLERHAAKKHNVTPSVTYPEVKETETGVICSSCPNKVFKSRQHIQLHMKKQHRPSVGGAEGQKKRPCPSCRKSFHKKAQLRLHVARVHEKKGAENAA